MTLDDIEKLCQEATEGPWEWEYTGSSDYWLTSNGERIDGLWDREDFNQHNREFIAAARSLMPKLLEVAKGIKIFLGSESHRCCEESNKLQKLLRELEKE